MALAQAHRQEERVPLPSEKPRCLPAEEMSWQGNEYVRRSKSAVCDQSILVMSPWLGIVEPWRAAYALIAYLSISDIPTV